MLRTVGLHRALCELAARGASIASRTASSAAACTSIAGSSGVSSAARTAPACTTPAPGSATSARIASSGRGCRIAAADALAPPSTRCCGAAPCAHGGDSPPSAPRSTALLRGDGGALPAPRPLRSVGSLDWLCIAATSVRCVGRAQTDGAGRERTIAEPHERSAATEGRGCRRPPRDRRIRTWSLRLLGSAAGTAIILCPPSSQSRAAHRSAWLRSLGSAATCTRAPGSQLVTTN